MQAGEEENEAAMKMHLVWNTHSRNGAGEQKATPGMGNSANSTEGTATQGSRDVRTGNRWQHSAEKQRSLHILNPRRAEKVHFN